MNLQLVRERLAEVMQERKSLTAFGMGICGCPDSTEATLSNLASKPRFAAEYGPRVAEFVKERAELVAAVDDIGWTVDWLRQHIEPTKAVNRRRSSYGLKHVAERHSPKRYLTNGVFIAAALIAGYRAEFVWNSPNVFFAMSERSIKAIALPHSY